MTTVVPLCTDTAFCVGGCESNTISASSKMTHPRHVHLAIPFLDGRNMDFDGAFRTTYLHESRLWR